jgi:hypothetical protein
MYYNRFNRSASSRDGFSNVCPFCENAPKLSTEEHVRRLREQNDNSSAVHAQRRPDEIDYLERDSVGRWMYHTQFIAKLRELLGEKLIVGDAYFLNEFSLYVEDPRCTTTNGVRYIGYISTGKIQEFSEYEYDRHGVAVNEVIRGYRGILMALILAECVTEAEVNKIFGYCDEKIWAKKLYNFRNKRQK